MSEELEGGKTDEILSRIDEQHRRGEHTLGPIAGCSFCAQQLAQTQERLEQSGGQPGADALAELAAVRARSAAERGRATAAMPALTPPVGEGTLGAVALVDAQQALDDLEALAQQGIVVPNAQQAIVHALVGVVRALVGIEEKLGATQTGVARLVAIQELINPDAVEVLDGPVELPEPA